MEVTETTIVFCYFFIIAVWCFGFIAGYVVAHLYAAKKFVDDLSNKIIYAMIEWASEIEPIEKRR